MHNASVAVSMHLASLDQEAPGDSTCASLAPVFNVRVGTILLVEDDTFVRDVAHEVLRSAGYGVLGARNAADAVRAFRGHGDRVQLLLTDVVLPDRDGCDLALELGTGESGLKAIFISGYPENCITRKGLQNPRRFYLPKPFSVMPLLRKIKEVLNELPHSRAGRVASIADPLQRGDPLARPAGRAEGQEPWPRNRKRGCRRTMNDGNLKVFLRALCG